VLRQPRTGLGTSAVLRSAEPRGGGSWIRVVFDPDRLFLPPGVACRRLGGDAARRWTPPLPRHSMLDAFFKGGVGDGFCGAKW
jgi:hypothetical protein